MRLDGGVAFRAGLENFRLHLESFASALLTQTAVVLFGYRHKILYLGQIIVPLLPQHSAFVYGLKRNNEVESVLKLTLPPLGLLGK